ncbi:MAG: hypothetical protein Q4G03_04000 [Planctomycetia bacterium]|nr:hypothetical protein [Planctomycetia bacterium]
MQKHKLLVQSCFYGSFLFLALLGSPLNLASGQEDLIQRVIDCVQEREAKIDTIRVDYNYSSGGSKVREYNNNYWATDKKVTRLVKNEWEVRFFEDESHEPIFVYSDTFAVLGDRFYYYQTPVDEYRTTDKFDLCDFRNRREKGYKSYIEHNKDRYIPMIVYSAPIFGYTVTSFNETRLPLKDFVKSCPPDRIELRTDETGDEIVDMEFLVPKNDAEPRNYGSYNVSVNLSKSAQVVASTDEWNFYHADTDSYVKTITELTCDDFREVIPGVWFPFHAVSIAHNGDREKAHVHTRYITKITLNEPLTEELKGFTFPEGLVVTEYGDNGFKTLWHVWGKKNKPVKTFDDHDKYLTYLSETCGFELRQPPQMIEPYKQPSNTRYILFALGVLLIFISVYVKRRRANA